MRHMILILLLLLTSSNFIFAQDSLRILTWNIQNMGQSKDDTKLEFMADICRHYDLIAIQEVSVGPAGAKAVAFLAEKLNRRGSAWDYRISDPTDGPGSERYAYLWKKHKVKAMGRCFLESKLADSLNREPYLCRFIAGKDTLLLSNFHAVPTQKGPARENSFLYLMTNFYPNEKLLIMGDFNLGQKNPAFKSLKEKGWVPALTGHKTSLRMAVRDGNHLASEYDNIFYPTHLLQKVSAGVDDFSRKFPTLTEARGISDHLPLWLTIQTSR